jgi:hypothetical protein
LFLPFRKGGSGLCQNVSISSIAGAFGSVVESSSVAVRVVGGEEVGLDVSVVFVQDVKRTTYSFFRVSYTCHDGLWHYSVFDGDGVVVAHVYRVGLMLLSQDEMVNDAVF